MSSSPDTRNEYVRKELHVTDIVTRRKDCQTKWFKNMERMEDQRIKKILFTYNPAGKRDPGRPQKIWNQ